MNWVCSCGAKAEERLQICPRCGRWSEYKPVVTVPNRGVSNSTRVVSGADLMADGMSSTKLKGIWSTLFPDGVSLPFMITVWGRPGVGKTQLGLKSANDWNGSPMFLALETGLGASIKSLMAYLETWDFDLSSPVDWESIQEVAVGYDYIVLDSLQSFSMSPAALRAEFVNNGISLMVLSQTNTSGDVRGGMASLHEADVSIELPELGRFNIVKNRFGELFEGEF